MWPQVWSWLQHAADLLAFVAVGLSVAERVRAMRKNQHDDEDE